MPNTLISRIIKPSSIYIIKATNFVDFLKAQKIALKQQDKFYDKTPQEYPKETVWDMVCFENVNQTVIDYLGDIKSKFILDLGSGIGADTRRFSALGADLISLDSSEKCLNISRQANNNLHIRAEATNLPFKNNVFDIVFGRDILHHLDEDKCLREVKRVLKKDGIAIFVEPLKYQPLVLIYRFIKQNERVPQHPFAPGKLGKISQKYFKKYEHKYLYAIFPFCYFFMIYFPSLGSFFSKIYLQKFSRLDDYVSHRFPFFSWTEVIKIYNLN